MNIPLVIVASLFFLIGFWGLIIPVIPDLPLIWLGVLIYGLGTRFADISLNTTLLLGVLSASTYLIDYLASSLGGKRYGASREGTFGAVIGGVVGLVIFPPFGFLIGSMAGTLIGEIVLARRSLDEATRASKGALIGLLLGLVAKVAIAGIIIGVFLKSVL